MDGLLEISLSDQSNHNHKSTSLFTYYVHVQTLFHIDRSFWFRQGIYSLVKLTINYPARKGIESIHLFFFSLFPFVINISSHTFAVEKLFQKSFPRSVYVCGRNVFRPWIVVDVLSMVNCYLSSD